MPSKKKERSKQKRKLKEETREGNRGGEAPLLLAARRGDLEALERLAAGGCTCVYPVAEKCPCPINAKLQGLTPETKRGELNITYTHVGPHGTPRCKDSDENHKIGGRKPLTTTALGTAVAHEQEEAVRLLLKLGANAGIRNSTGLTPVIEACARGNHVLLKMMLDPSNPAARPQPDLNNPGQFTTLYAKPKGPGVPIRALLGVHEPGEPTTFGSAIRS